MYLIVVGAGAVTKHLIAIAKQRGHQIAVIEKEAEKARAIVEEFDVRVFHADIVEKNILEEANVKNADAIIATTTDDTVNLMAMVLSKHYQVKNSITMLQANHHRAMFEQLGVQVLTEPEKLIAQKLVNFLDVEA